MLGAVLVRPPAGNGGDRKDGKRERQEYIFMKQVGKRNVRLLDNIRCAHTNCIYQLQRSPESVLENVVRSGGVKQERRAR